MKTIADLFVLADLATRRNKLDWRRSSQASDLYIAEIGDGRIGIEHVFDGIDEGYRFAVLDSNETPMEESIFWSGDYYRAYKDLHEAARRNALGLQEVLDLMASELEETLQVRVENLVKPDEFDPFSDS